MVDREGRVVLHILERSHLAGIEGDKRRAAYWASLEIDDVIEIPGKQGGKAITLRYLERGGRLDELAETEDEAGETCQH